MRTHRCDSKEGKRTTDQCSKLIEKYEREERKRGKEKRSPENEEKRKNKLATTQCYLLALTSGDIFLSVPPGHIEG